jgi:hypothetical protein
MLQQVLRRLEKAFIGMWESGRGFPRFKKQGRMRSLLFPQLGVKPIQGIKSNFLVLVGSKCNYPDLYLMGLLQSKPK